MRSATLGADRPTARASSRVACRLSNNADGVPEWPSFDDIDRVDMSLDTLIPDNPNKPYDMKELILKVVDEGDFFEISETFAKNIVTGFGRIAGRTVGFVANQPMVLAGVLDSDASRKAARFVRFCDAFLDARAAGVVEPDDRRPRLHRHVLDFYDFLRVSLR